MSDSFYRRIRINEAPHNETLDQYMPPLTLIQDSKVRIERDPNKLDIMSIQTENILTNRQIEDLFWMIKAMVETGEAYSNLEEEWKED